MSATIHINPGPNLAANSQALAAANEAANYVASLFTDNVTIEVDAEFNSATGGMSTNSSFFSNSYSVARGLLTADAASDESIVSSLPTSMTYSAPTGVTVNSSSFTATRAQLLALGVSPSSLNSPASAYNASVSDIDMSISIAPTTSLSWDFNRADGIAASGYDFVGVFAHELTHGLGFVSSVDSIYAGATTVTPTIMDLFRIAPNTGGSFSSTNRILTPGTAAVFDDGAFSPSSVGLTGVGSGEIPLSTGGSSDYQASHWKDDTAIGVYLGSMDPGGGTGQFFNYLSTDIRALGLMGWDVNPLNATLTPAGALTINGSISGDTISLTSASGVVTATVNGVTSKFSSTAITSAVVNGGDGNDTLSVSSAITLGVTLNGGNGNDTLTGGNGADTIDGGTGNDLVRGSFGNDVVQGGGDAGDQADYSLLGGGYSVAIGFGNTWSAVYIRDGSGTGTGDVSSFSGIGTFTGTNSSDFFNMAGATAANYTVNGGSGTDEASYAGMTSGYTVSVGFGNSTSTGYVNSGGTWNSYYSNLSGVETFTGSNGNDFFNMSNATGANYTINGGSGNDQASYAGMSAGYTVAIGFGNSLSTAYVNSGGTWNSYYSNMSGVETFTGSTGSDYFNMSNATTADFVIYGNGGADQAGYTTMAAGYSVSFGLENTLAVGYVNYGGTWNNHSSTFVGVTILLGSGGNDYVNGANATSTGYVIYGLGGNDTFNGGGGNDTFYGGDDNDSLYGNGGNDTLYGEGGTDLLDGGTGTNTLVQ